MTIPKNTIGSQVRSVFSRSTSRPIGSARERAVAATRRCARASRQASRAAFATVELIARRLGRREVALELEAGAREDARDRMRRIARDPREDLDRAADRAGRPDEAREAARACRRLRGDHVDGERRRDHRRDELRPAARMLLRRRLAAVLVRPDGDVLGAVVGREVRTAQRECRREERDTGRGDLPRAGRESRPA